MSTYHYTDSGLDFIYLANGYNVVKTPYGEGVAIHDLEGLHIVIGSCIADRPIMTGDEFRFLRIELGLSQVEVANLIGVGESAVRNWEKGRTQHVPRPSANLMRGLYLESIDATSKLSKILKNISHLNREIHHIEMNLEETEEGWKLAA
ncbi:MAG: helix-turn-helix domain-containing protein [Mariprofundus sp.]|nr:helix-turn-helix domain-containing protein [Mariprofundus sp.]